MQRLLINLRISASALSMLVEMMNGIPAADRQSQGQIDRLGNETISNLPELSVLAILLPPKLY